MREYHPYTLQPLTECHKYHPLVVAVFILNSVVVRYIVVDIYPDALRDQTVGFIYILLSQVTTVDNRVEKYLNNKKYINIF